MRTLLRVLIVILFIINGVAVGYWFAHAVAGHGLWYVGLGALHLGFIVCLVDLWRDVTVVFRPDIGTDLDGI